MHAPGSYRPHPSSIFLFFVGYSDRDCRTLCSIFFQCKRSMSCAGRTIHQDFVEIDVASLIVASPTVTLSTLILANCLREPVIINLVLESLMKSRFDGIQLRTSAIDFSIVLTAFDCEIGLNDTIGIGLNVC